MAQIYVSSTFSDLEPFRARVRDILRKRGHIDVAMELYGAEDKRPLDKCLEDVEKCDLYIGIFAWRYGYIPPEHEKSITELEFLNAVKYDKSRLLFLVADDAPWPGNLFERNKYQEVENLRKHISEDRIVSYFSNEDQLSTEVLEAIVQWEEEQGIEPQISAVDWEQYKNNLKKEHQWVRLNVIAGPRQDKITQIPLVEVFVPQLAAAKLPLYDIPDDVLRSREEFFKKPTSANWIEDDQEPDAADAPEVEFPPSQGAKEQTEAFPEVVFDIIGRERTQVVVGVPGVGKTSLLHYILLRLVDPKQESLPTYIQTAAIPFLVELRQFLLSKKTSFVDFIATNCTQRYGVSVGTEELKSLLNESGRSLVFFDGLDEVFNPKDRGQVIQQFKSFAQEYPNAQIIVTTRIAGYQPDELQLADFRHYTLLGFNIQQTTDFVRKWYTYYTWEGDERTAAGLIRRITENPRLMELAGNPLLLTMMAILYKHQDLPEKRWQLYERATSVLVDDWDIKRKLFDREEIIPLPQDVRISKDQKVKLLQRVSIYMLGHGQSGKELNAIAYPQLMDILTQFLRDEYGKEPGPARDLASEILNYLRMRTYILAEIGEHIYGFVHRTFMEYFAASNICVEFNAKESDYDWLNKEIFGTHWNQDEWREVLFLLVAMLVDQGSPVKKIIEYLYELADTPPLSKAFAAHCLAESIGTGNQELANILFIDLAKAVSEFAESRKQQTVAFVEEALLAFSMLARIASVPSKVNVSIKALNKKGSLQARMAAWQLGFAMQTGQERLTFALNALQDSEEAVRRGAIRVLEREWPGREDVKQALIEVLRNDRHVRVKQAAIDVIQRGWPKDEQVLDAIETRLTEEIAYTYAERLIEYLVLDWKGSPRALELVLQLAGAKFKSLDFGSTANVDEYAVKAIVQGWRDSDAALPLLFNQIAHASNSRIRIISLQALTNGWANDPTVLSMLRDRLNDDAVDVRKEVVHALGAGWANGPTILSMLQDRLTNDTDAQVRIEAVRALATGRANGPTVLSMLQDRLTNDTDAQVRIEAVRALATRRVNGPTILSMLQDRLTNDTDAQVRIEAVRALATGWANDPTVLSMLQDRLTNATDAQLRTEAVRALETGWANDPTVLSMLRDRLNDDAVDVRKEVVHALGAGWASNPTVLSTLQDRLTNDTDAQVRIEAVIALATGWANDPTILSMLQDRLTNDTDAQVRIEAVRALATGWGNDPTVLSMLRDRLTNATDAQLRCLGIALQVGDTMLLSPYFCFFSTRGPSYFYLVLRDFYSSDFFFGSLDSLIKTLSFYLELPGELPLFQDVIDVFTISARGVATNVAIRFNDRLSYEYRQIHIDHTNYSNLMDLAVGDNDRVVRATAGTYAALLAAKEEKVDDFLKAWQMNEPDKSLRNYIERLSKFLELWWEVYRLRFDVDEVPPSA
jgi:hypothetical protein